MSEQVFKICPYCQRIARKYETNGRKWYICAVRHLFNIHAPTLTAKGKAR